ncbi:MAG: hypothetical protein MN733_18040 [Nitrososphaera sp.]|nr:hypothetical protein [Nitrososphaera sp.]
MARLNPLFPHEGPALVRKIIDATPSYGWYEIYYRYQDGQLSFPVQGCLWGDGRPIKGMSVAVTWEDHDWACSLG